MFHMLTKQDRKYIDDLFDEKIGVLAIMIQNGFDELNRNKADKTDLKTAIDRLEGRMNTLEFKLITAPNNRLDKVEDDIRQIKSKVGLV